MICITRHTKCQHNLSQKTRKWLDRKGQTERFFALEHLHFRWIRDWKQCSSKGQFWNFNLAKEHSRFISCYAMQCTLTCCSDLNSSMTRHNVASLNLCRKLLCTFHSVCLKCEIIIFRFHFNRSEKVKMNRKHIRTFNHQIASFLFRSKSESEIWFRINEFVYEKSALLRWRRVMIAKWSVDFVLF